MLVGASAVAGGHTRCARRCRRARALRSSAGVGSPAAAVAASARVRAVAVAAGVLTGGGGRVCRAVAPCPCGTSRVVAVASVAVSRARFRRSGAAAAAVRALAFLAAAGVTCVRGSAGRFIEPLRGRTPPCGAFSAARLVGFRFPLPRASCSFGTLRVASNGTERHPGSHSGVSPTHSRSLPVARLDYLKKKICQECIAPLIQRAVGERAAPPLAAGTAASS